MDCTRWTEAISAVADGEDPGIDPLLVDAHASGCDRCGPFRASLDRSVGTMRLATAPTLPDLGTSVATRAAVADRASRPAWLRWLLVLVALQIIALSAPALLFGNESGSSPHGARHLGAFTTAYAVGLLVVAFRPARVRTMLPVAQVLVGALVISTIVDVADGRIEVTNELAHLPEAISLVALWLYRPD